MSKDKRLEHFEVKPGSSLRLDRIDTGYQGGYPSEASAAADTAHHLLRITELQRKLYGDRSRALLIVLQGIDSAGKDGTCWHVIGAMDPQGVHVTGFKQPTPLELAHHFLWRVEPHAPARGEVSIFNRSHYEDVLIAKVHALAPAEIIEQRYDFINTWERMLVEQNNTTILKFFLNISKDEQLARFRERLDNPEHQWKISEADYTERDRWDDYTQAFNIALTRCSTRHAPWFIIPSDNKWYRNLAIAKIIADTLEGMHLQLPAPTVDIDDIRKRYHAEVVADTKGVAAKRGIARHRDPVCGKPSLQAGNAIKSQPGTGLRFGLSGEVLGDHVTRHRNMREGFCVEIDFSEINLADVQVSVGAKIGNPVFQVIHRDPLRLLIDERGFASIPGGNLFCNRADRDVDGIQNVKCQVGAL